MRDLKITLLGGNCPVQAEGTIAGLPFYFRARGDSWSFSVAETPDGDPIDVNCGFADGFIYEEMYGEGPYDAGWMEEAEAEEFIHKAADLFLAQVSSEPLTNVEADKASHAAQVDGEGSREASPND